MNGAQLLVVHCDDRAACQSGIPQSEWNLINMTGNAGPKPTLLNDSSTMVLRIPAPMFFGSRGQVQMPVHLYPDGQEHVD